MIWGSQKLSVYWMDRMLFPRLNSAMSREILKSGLENNQIHHLAVNILTCTIARPGFKPDVSLIFLTSIPTCSLIFLKENETIQIEKEF